MENLTQEELDVINEFNEYDASITNLKETEEETIRSIKIDRNDLIGLKEKAEKLEFEMNAKEKLYNDQIKIDKNIRNIQIKHVQKVQELEKLQNTFFELENKKDEAHCKLAQRSQEVKLMIKIDMIII